jgi:hypothetical protein
VVEAAASLSVLVKTHLWVWWADIAIDQRNLARVGREELLKRTREGSDLDLSLESRPALIAVAGASHAIDAFYGEARELIPIPKALSDAWRRKRTGRPERIRETLKLGFGVGKHGAQWKIDFDWLFDLRDAAVHHSSQATPTVPHPALPTNVTPESADYVTEASDRAVNVMFRVFDQCIATPKSTLPDLVVWANSLRPTIDALRGTVCGTVWGTF